jgi:hypothetical protein
MLEVIVSQGYALNLSADIEINFIEENPLFLDDRVPAPYSLTFEIPPTPSNLKALGFPDRISSSSIQKRLPSEIRFQGMVMARGEVLLIETDPTIKLQFKGSREPEGIEINLNQIDLGAREYGSFQYHSEDLDYNSPPLEDYVQSMRSMAYQGSDYVIAPVRLKDVPWSGSESKGGLANTLKQYINYFNPVTRNFFLTDSQKAHTPILPFPFVYKIINQAFGKYLVSNPFATGDLSRLVLISLNHKYYSFDNLFDWYWIPPLEEQRQEVVFPLVDSYESSGGLIPISWEMKSFQQAFPFKDLIKNLLKIFCITAYPGIRYRLEFTSDVMQRQVRRNWDNKLVGDPIITYEEARDYIFRYDGVDKSEEDMLRTYSSVKEIFDTAVSSGSESGTVYADGSTGAQYNISRKLRGLGSLPWLSCSIKHSALASREPEGRLKTEIVSEIKPAEMVIDQYWWQDNAPSSDIVQKKHWWVPMIEKRNLSEAPYLMFWAGMSGTFLNDGSEYPLLMAHHTDHLGNKRLNTSLHPEGSGGLIEKYHSEIKAWTEKDKMKVRGSFHLSPLELRHLDIRDKIYLKGRLFYIEKLNYSLSNVHLSLVEVDLVEC